MRFDLDDLPSEPALLQHLIRDMAAAVEHCDGEIERLKSTQTEAKPATSAYSIM
jgi:transposase